MDLRGVELMEENGHQLSELTGEQLRGVAGEASYYVSTLYGLMTLRTYFLQGRK